MNHFYQKIPGWCHFEAVYRHAVMRAPIDRKSVFVEIGAWKGKSTAYMGVEVANSRKPIKFFAVDHWLGSDERLHQRDRDVVNGTLYEAFLKNIQPVREFVKPLKMSSVNASMLFDPQSIDFIFFDGGHDYESVQSDLSAWMPKLRHDAVVAGDDYNWDGVQRALKEFYSPEQIEVLGAGPTRHWRIK